MKQTKKNRWLDLAPVPVDELLLELDRREPPSPLLCDATEAEIVKELSDRKTFCLITLGDDQDWEHGSVHRDEETRGRMVAALLQAASSWHTYEIEYLHAETAQGCYDTCVDGCRSEPGGCDNAQEETKA